MSNSPGVAGGAAPGAPRGDLSRGDRLVERTLEAASTKVVVVLLIALSLLPECDRPYLHLFVFLPLFAGEFAFRLRLHLARRGRLRRLAARGDPPPPGSRRRFEPVLLAFDFLAVLSFLPLGHVFESARLLRLWRLLRLVLVLRYAADLLRDVWLVVTRRERLGQLLLMLVTVATMSFVAAALLLYAEPDSPIHNGSVVDAFWWAFLQIESADNIVGTLHEHPAVVAASILLTATGIFLMAFLIGLGTNVVSALVAAARQRPVDLGGHTVLVAPPGAARRILRDLGSLETKNRAGPQEKWSVEPGSLARRWRRRIGARRMVLVGTDPEPPPFLLDPEMRRTIYRSGHMTNVADAARVGAGQARRIVLVPDDADPAAADDRCLSTALALSDVAARAARAEAAGGDGFARDVYLEIRSAANAGVAHRIMQRLHDAGIGCRILDVETLAGRFLAQHVIDPGVDPVYEEILSANGNEIYTHTADAGGTLRTAVPASGDGPPACWIAPAARSWSRYRVIPIGVLTRVREDDAPRGASLLRRVHGCRVRLDAVGSARPADVPDIAAFVTVAPAARHAQTWARDLALGRLDGEADADPAPAADALAAALEFRGRAVRRVLLVGDHPSLPALVLELIRFLPGIEVRVLPESPPAGAAALAAAFERPLRVLDPGVRVTPDGGVLEIRLGDGRSGRVGPYPGGGDGGGDATSTALGTEDFGAFDRAVFLSDPSDPASDDRTTVRLLRAAGAVSGLGRCGIVAQVESESRAALLTTSFHDRGGGGSEGRPAAKLSVLAAEQIRSHFLAQAIFTPGLAPVLEELLSERGYEIVRLERRPGSAVPGDPVSFGDVLTALARRGPGSVTPIAWVVERDGVERTVLNPEPSARPRADRVVAVYAVADAASFGSADPPPESGHVG